MSMFMVTAIYLLLLSVSALILALKFFTCGTMVILEYHLINDPKLNFSYSIFCDWKTLVFLGTVFFISSTIFFYSMDYMKSDQNKIRFCMMMISFVFSMFLLVISGNMISILMGWDALGLVSYCLVIYYQSFNSYKGGMLTLLNNRVGDISILFSLTLFITQDSSNISFLSLSGESIEWWLTIILIIAASTKSAQVPFSSWLPAAMAAPTPVSSLVHSSTLVTAGIYLMCRFDFIFHKWSILLLSIVSLLTLLMSSTMALSEWDLKKVIALSTLNQLGFMMFSLALHSSNFTFFHMIIHAFFKALMFLCGGLLIHETKEQNMRKIGGFAWLTNSSKMGLMISSSCLMGVPFLAGFYSKDLILESYFASSKNFIVFFLFLINFMMSISYTSRLLFILMISHYQNNPTTKFNEPFFMTLSIYTLLGVSVMSGASFQWLFQFDTKSVLLSNFYKTLSLTLLIFSATSTLFILNSKMFLKANSNFLAEFWYTSKLMNKLILGLLPISLVSKDDDKWSESMEMKGLSSLLLKLLKKSVNFSNSSMFLSVFMMASMFTFTMMWF